MVYCATLTVLLGTPEEERRQMFNHELRLPCVQDGVGSLPRRWLSTKHERSNPHDIDAIAVGIDIRDSVVVVSTARPSLRSDVFVVFQRVASLFALQLLAWT